jgi:predicted TIM-barrel fold metal-dependent hydrolase
MITRRAILIGTAAAAATALLKRAPRALARASQPATPVRFQVPAGACDSHTHIFGDPQRFPFWSGRTYTPEPASIDEMRALHRALHTERVVIVQPSVYGADNACTLDALRQFAPRARGIAVIDDKTSEAQLDEMARAGIRGIRLNFETFGQTDPDALRQQFQAAVRRVAARKWHIQMYTRLPVIAGLEKEILAAPVPVVIDHFGGAEASRGTRQPGFGTLVGLVRSGKAYVKISAPYRISNQRPDYLGDVLTRDSGINPRPPLKPLDYEDVAPLAKELILANPQRILWGSDWPHPAGAPLPGHTAADVAPLLQINDGFVLNHLAVWAPDAALRKTILVENPARLYRF